MSKLSFRARALDASKPMPVYMAEDLPDLPDYSAINRAVPQMPSGMEKEEECEHHLQRAICAGLIIPTPEVSELPEKDFHDKAYPKNYKLPRQLIYMQPFALEQDIPDYDMDSEDELWLQGQTQKLHLTPTKFEEMMDRLEKSSGQTVVTLNEAKALLKEDDDLIIAVFDYWLNKRLKTQHPLILTVKTEFRTGIAANNPYLAFRRRTEKMQTRKNRKNDETSYEKMLKLRRDLYRAVTLLELVKKREKFKRELVHLTVDVFDKRYQARDFSGAIYSEASAVKATRPAFTPIFHNHYTNQSWNQKAILKDEIIPRKEKRQYKKRKHKGLSHRAGYGVEMDGVNPLSSDDEMAVPSRLTSEQEDVEEEGAFTFRRNGLCSYYKPSSMLGNWPWCSREENGTADKRFRFTLTSTSNPKRCIGFARRRFGRGGRVILDRVATDNDDFWRTLDFSIIEPKSQVTTANIQQGDANKSVVSSVVSDLRTDKAKSELYSNIYNNNTSDNNSRTSLTNLQINTRRDSVPFSCDPVSKDTDADSMVDFLRSLRSDWLHFRPKTPPSDRSSTPPSEMLPADHITYSANTSFALELQALETPNTLLDHSLFLTDPFVLDGAGVDSCDIPIVDTRQMCSTPTSSGSTSSIMGCSGVTTNCTLTTATASTIINNNNNSSNNNNYNANKQNVQKRDINPVTQIVVKGCNVGLNTLTSSSGSQCDSDVKSNTNPNCNNINDNKMIMDGVDEVFHQMHDDKSVVGCSRFYVSDMNSRIKQNSNAIDVKSQQQQQQTNCTFTSRNNRFNSSNSNSNMNLVTSAEMDKQQPRDCSAMNNTNGLLAQLGFEGASGRTKNKHTYAYSSGAGYSKIPVDLPNPTHTTTTLMLNSHSANILEIPLNNSTDNVVTNKLSNAVEVGGSTKSNNKKSTIVRKNNLVMEVT